MGAVNPGDVELGETKGRDRSEHGNEDASRLGGRPSHEHARCDCDCDAIKHLEYTRAGRAKVNDANR
jgi:hypothetical protein